MISSGCGFQREYWKQATQLTEISLAAIQFVAHHARQIHHGRWMPMCVIENDFFTLLRRQAVCGHLPTLIAYLNLDPGINADVLDPITIFSPTRGNIENIVPRFVFDNLDHSLVSQTTLSAGMCEHKKAFAQQPAKIEFV